MTGVDDFYIYCDDGKELIFPTIQDLLTGCKRLFYSNKIIIFGKRNGTPLHSICVQYKEDVEEAIMLCLKK